MKATICKTVLFCWKPIILSAALSTCWQWRVGVVQSWQPWWAWWCRWSGYVRTGSWGGWQPHDDVAAPDEEGGGPHQCCPPWPHEGLGNMGQREGERGKGGGREGGGRRGGRERGGRRGWEGERREERKLWCSSTFHTVHKPWTMYIYAFHHQAPRISTNTPLTKWLWFLSSASLSAGRCLPLRGASVSRS